MSNQVNNITWLLSSNKEQIVWENCQTIIILNHIKRASYYLFKKKIASDYQCRLSLKPKD